MQFAICRPAAHAGQGATDILEQNRLRWLRFGNEYFCHTVDPTGTIAWNALDASGLAFKNVIGHPVGSKEQALYVVVQEGRSFQRAYPDVAVLYDKGRHLVVSLDRRRAGKITQHDAHFAIRPVTKNEAIVDVVRRPSTPPSIEPRIKKLVDAVSRTNFAATLSELASYPTRHSLSGHFQDAAKRTRDRLQLMGYEVRLQDVALPGGKSLNIVADKKGSADGKRSLTLVTAHLDSVNHPADPSQEDPTAPAPGADDNGSGSAGVIEIARLFRDRPITQDLRLILFGGEEQGLCGSREYLKQLPAAERARIKAVVNMDMIAVLNTTSPTVLLEGGDPFSKDLVAGLASAAHAYTRLEVNTAWDPHDSDHEPFISAGLPAVLTIEGGDEANANIHNAKDTLDRINYDLGLEIVRMNTAFVADRTGV
jgi:Peptidase family M28